jgi:hypothetical protein
VRRAGAIDGVGDRLAALAPPPLVVSGRRDIDVGSEALQPAGG